MDRNPCFSCGREHLADTAQWNRSSCQRSTTKAPPAAELGDGWVVIYANGIVERPSQEILVEPLRYRLRDQTLDELLDSLRFCAAESRSRGERPSGDVMVWRRGRLQAYLQIRPGGNYTTYKIKKSLVHANVMK
jgi:hypothetical protein